MVLDRIAERAQLSSTRLISYHFAGKGDLAGVRPDEMAAQVVRALVEATGAVPGIVLYVAESGVMPLRNAAR